MMVKLTTGVNFINILHTNFSYEYCFSSFFYVHVTREKLPKQRLYEKFARKMLMKLTPARIKASNKMLVKSTRVRLSFCGYNLAKVK